MIAQNIAVAAVAAFSVQAAAPAAKVNQFQRVSMFNMETRCIHNRCDP